MKKIKCRRCETIYSVPDEIIKKAMLKGELNGIQYCHECRIAYRKEIEVSFPKFLDEVAGYGISVEGVSKKRLKSLHETLISKNERPDFTKAQMISQIKEYCERYKKRME